MASPYGDNTGSAACLIHGEDRLLTTCIELENWDCTRIRSPGLHSDFDLWSWQSCRQIGL